jgi:parvulin-like peptidyl-prolyl isomerase
MARIVAGTLALAGAMGTVSAQAPAPPGVAAVVNGQPIPMADFQAAMRQLPPNPVELPADRQKGIQREVLGMMMDEVLMAQFLARNAPPPSPTEVETKMAEILEALKKEGKTLADFCKQSNTTEANFRKDLAVRVQWNNFALARINDADTGKYYQENKDFFDGVMVRTSHIVLRLPQTATEAERAKARSQLTELRNQILQRKIDFATAAKTYSMCPSAEKGGDIGFIPRKGLVEENFARMAFAMQVNQLSDVVDTGFGLHLILVTERKPGNPSDYSKIKEDVRMMCMGELFQLVLNEQRKTARIEVYLP